MDATTNVFSELPQDIHATTSSKPRQGIRTTSAALRRGHCACHSAPADPSAIVQLEHARPVRDLLELSALVVQIELAVEGGTHKDAARACCRRQGQYFGDVEGGSAMILAPEGGPLVPVRIEPRDGNPPIVGLEVAVWFGPGGEEAEELGVGRRAALVIEPSETRAAHDIIHVGLPVHDVAVRLCTRRGGSGNILVVVRERTVGGPLGIRDRGAVDRHLHERHGVRRKRTGASCASPSRGRRGVIVLLRASAKYKDRGKKNGAGVRDAHVYEMNMERR